MDKTKNSGFLDIAKEASVKAGEILIDNLGKVKNISYKARNDLLTEVDIKSEDSIVSYINHHFPAHSILAEESSRTDILSDYVWIIDPLDGTMNYTHTYPFFSVSIALQYLEEIILGVVFDPVRNEIFYSEKDRGAYLNNVRIKPSSSNKIDESLLVTGFLHEKEILVERNLKHFSNFIWQARGVRRDGSAALDLCYVACGRYDGFWELGLRPWDMAGGSIIVEESGGTVTNITGGKFSIYEDEIVASNGKIHLEMLKVLSASN